MLLHVTSVPLFVLFASWSSMKAPVGRKIFESPGALSFALASRQEELLEGEEGRIGGGLRILLPSV